MVGLTRNLSSMMKAGLPLTRALFVLERQTKNARLKKIMKDAREDINKGKQFNEALAIFPKVFSELYVAMVRAGEEGGQLSGALETLSIQMERSSTLKKKIKGAMIYPSIVIIVMMIIGVLMMIYVVPSITATFTSMDVELPMTTQILIGTSNFMSQHSLIVIFGASRDLAHRKLLPALYNLVQKGLLPDDFTIVGYSRTAYTDAEFREMARGGVEKHADVEFREEAWQQFAQGIFYVTGGYDNPEGFARLKERIEAL